MNNPQGENFQSTAIFYQTMPSPSASALDEIQLELFTKSAVREKSVGCFYVICYFLSFSMRTCARGPNERLYFYLFL